MPNVDLCSRYAEAGLCGDAEQNAQAISTLADELRVVIFRGKDAGQIKELLEKYSRTIKERVTARYGFSCEELLPSSNDNRDGADLYCISPENGERITIEVKFGSYTDKAAGMKQVGKIFGTSIFTDALAPRVRRGWIDAIVSEYPDMGRQSERLIRALNDAIEEFNAHMDQQGHALTNEQQEYMEEYLFNNSGSYESATDDYMRFETTPKGDKIVEAVPIAEGVGRWMVEPIEEIAMGDERPRVNLHVKNDTTQVTVKFVLNNKNDYKIRGHDIKVRSKYMVNSPSWNVWVKRAGQD